ncbi:Putative 26S proteasome non-ATPase regulatory subunit 8 homolog B [Linum perenne]
MDPKLKEVSQYFERFKAACVKEDIDTSASLLSQLKVRELSHRNPNFLCLDLLALKLSFCYCSSRLSPSPQEHMILGLNLLRLLVQNRIAEFHTELELLPASSLEDPCIKHAVELEQSFMEGAYNRVLTAKQTVPYKDYDYFMDLLAKTVRDEIAGCSEKAYDSLSINNARQILLFSSDNELHQYIKEEHPEWETKDGFIVFQKAKESAPCKEIPSLQLINQTLSYARELERIV